MNKIEKNQIYGNLKTIEKAYSKPGAVYWKFECLLCGNEHIACVSDVRRGKIKSCGCKINQKQRNGMWKGYEDLSGRLYGHYKSNAKKRGIDWKVSIEDLWEVYLKQNKKCAYTDVELIIGVINESSRTAINASLDRIDSKIGYTKDNIQWVYKPINNLKNTLSHDEFLNLCFMVSKKYFGINETK